MLSRRRRRRRRRAIRILWIKNVFEVKGERDHHPVAAAAVITVSFIDAKVI